MARDYWFHSVGPVVRSGPEPRHAVIRPYLLVGEYLRPDDVGWLKDPMRITGVLCLQDSMDLARKALSITDLAQAYADAGIEFRHAPVPDGEQVVLSERLPEIVQSLAELIARGHTVYVHCNAGMNRAPTVAVAYLHQHESMALEAARDFVKQRHPCVPYMRMLEAHYAAR